MKTIGRIAIILFAALVVVGATVAFSQSTVAASMFSRGGRAGFERREFERAVPQGESPEGQFPGNFERRGRGEGAGGINVFAIGPIIKDVVIMGAITAIVIAVTVMLRNGKRLNRESASLAAGQAAKQREPV